MCTAHAIDNCAHQIKRSCVPFLIREGRISWWAVLWNTDKISQHYQIDECRNPGHYIKASGIEIVHENANFCGSETDFPQREKNCPWGKEIGSTKKEEKKKGSSGFSSAPNTSETYRARSHASWLHNFQYSHLLLLSWAGNRLECSHSYTLLRYISVKKKQMLWKFWRLIVQGRGVGGLDFRVFLSNHFPCLELFPSDLLLLDPVDCFSPQFALPGREELYGPCSPQAFLWYLL